MAADQASIGMDATLTPVPDAPRKRNAVGVVLFWTVIVGLLIGELLLFRAYVKREISSSYPRNMDQVCYLCAAYDLYELARSAGLIPALYMEWTAPRATGVLFIPETVLLFEIFGPSRQTALLMNFLSYAGFQVVFVATTLWLTRRYSYAVGGLGLLLAWQSPLNSAGGLFDFRMDFSTLCQFGIVLCLVVRSDGFRDRRWALAAGLLAGHLILFRFITAVYLAGMFGTLLAWHGVWWLIRRDSENRERALGILGTGIVISLVVVPVFVAQRDALCKYYLQGHFTGQESGIRRAVAGVETPWDDLAYYPNSLLNGHLGRRSLAIGGGLLLLAGLLRGIGKRDNSPGSKIPGFLPVLLAVAVPLGVLTLDPAKSDVVAGIMAPAFALLLMLGVGAMVNAATLPARASFLVWVVALECLVWGAAKPATYYVESAPTTSCSEDHQQLRNLFDNIARTSKKRHEGIRLSVDHIDDFSQGLVGVVMLYERHHERTPIRGYLGRSIFSITRDEAFEAIKKSNYVLLTDDSDDLPALYPFDQCMREIRSEIAAYCDSHMVLLDEYRFFGRHVLLYTTASHSLVQ